MYWGAPVLGVCLQWASLFGLFYYKLPLLVSCSSLCLSLFYLIKVLLSQLIFLPAIGVENVFPCLHLMQITRSEESLVDSIKMGPVFSPLCHCVCVCLGPLHLIMDGYVFPAILKNGFWLWFFSWSVISECSVLFGFLYCVS